MSKNTDKKYVRDLASICQNFGMQDIIFSPGSRLAPVILAFEQQKKINKRVVVDERVAGFVALGLAQQTRKPVGLVCTSGTALLNYAPAIAEAYYQRIPLVVMTADRPKEWIDQADMQSIQQPDVFENYIRKSVNLSASDTSKEGEWYNQRLVSEALNAAVGGEFGPVHINVPLKEPLYETEKVSKAEKPKVFKKAELRVRLSDKSRRELSKKWANCDRKLVLLGLHHPDPILNDLLMELADDPSVVIMGETCSNLQGDFFFENIDRVVEVLFTEFSNDLHPEIVVTMGGMIVSKKIKQFLRKHRPKEHWHVRLNSEPADTFRSLTQVIGMEARDFANEMVQFPKREGASFQEMLSALDSSNYLGHLDYLRVSPYCDLTVFANILDVIPMNTKLQLGNSTPVRYANLFPLYDKNLVINSNRGVGGIDGTTSTAIGAAMADSELTTLITGDLAFFYDSNGLWQEELPNNLRIILINNGGGNIFRIIPGPESTGVMEKYFEAGHNLDGRYYAKMFGLKYATAKNHEEVEDQLAGFWKKSKSPILLEIFTDGEVSASVLKGYFDHIKKDFGPTARKFRKMMAEMRK